MKGKPNNLVAFTISDWAGCANDRRSTTGKIELRHCNTEEQPADILTKALAEDKFKKFRSMMGVQALIELWEEMYNAEVLDSYEHLLLDVTDGHNHLFMRNDELEAAWKVLSPILQEIDSKSMAPKLYELGGRGPVRAFYLWAKHGVQ
ncbi:inactive glucose-6-phosphate 1-dehydrogenase 4, chloroplastic-like [Camellia sinensis]|uniref:inactive glucose-6-phosphate 1-dehydrogenase 4, chloroplastic-like n=1 Tax=Camellia sinensis TaxID=4442 RepID=UPI0010358748|nr:inactive glucose-6-phosphate 1-dehydrogenase 4, chloroplastic-like [Camellia sinensis]